MATASITIHSFPTVVANQQERRQFTRTIGPVCRHSVTETVTASAWSRSINRSGHLLSKSRGHGRPVVGRATRRVTVMGIKFVDKMDSDFELKPEVKMQVA
eukprot:9018310-Pyramimonas_sp.AAC.1